MVKRKESRVIIKNDFLRTQDFHSKNCARNKNVVELNFNLRMGDIIRFFSNFALIWNSVVKAYISIRAFGLCISL